MSIVRKLRGILGMAVLWSAGFVVFGMLLVIVIGMLDSGSIDAGEGPIDIAPLFALLGAIAGTLFGAAFALGERRRTFQQLSLPRMAAWGALGGALLPLLLLKPLGNVAVFAPLGALLASGSLALARRARDRAAEGSEPAHLLPDSAPNPAGSTKGAPRDALREQVKRN